MFKGLAEKLGLLDEEAREAHPNLDNQVGYLKQMQDKNMYAGTVPQSIVDQRRKKNKEARHARRINRSR